MSNQLQLPFFMSCPTSNQRVAIFLLEWDYQIHTEQLVEELLNLGLLVDLYLHATENTGVHSIDRLNGLPGLSVHNSCRLLTNDLTAVFRDKSGAFVGRIRNRLHQHLDPLWFFLGAKGPNSFAWTRRQYPIPRAASKEYLFAIGVEDQGFVWASWSLSGRCPVYLYSLELFTERHSMYYGWRFLALRRRLSYWLKRAAGLIIQDRFRAEVLLEAAQLGPTRPKVYELPVSLKKRQASTRAASLRERLNLPDTEIVVVYVGNLTPIRKCIEIGEQALSFPKGWTLVMHGRWMGPPDFKKRLEAFRHHPQIRFSETLVDDDQMGDLIDGCDAGLALYENINLNYYHTGYASEKIALYLSRSVPIITFDYPTNLDCFSRWKCGVPIAGMEELAGAIRTITADARTFGQGAAAAFTECYDFDAVKGTLRSLVEDAAATP